MEDKLLAILNSVLTNADLPQQEKLVMDQHLRNDLGLDSLNLAELTVKIEDEFDVDVFEDDVVSTLGEIAEIIRKKIA